MRSPVTRPFSAAARADALDALARTEFDVLVIGGGITGVAVARDAAMRGLRTALVEREDFASGTSSRSSRLVHGGIRYLEHGELHLVFESSRERRILLHLAPHLVRPLLFIWPVFERARIPLWKLRAALFLYDALSFFRNVAPHRTLDPQLVETMEPALRSVGLLGGATYYDAATDDARLTLATARAAADEGAIVVNHAAVRALGRAGDSIAGADVEDLLGGRALSIRARVLVNATGPWSDDIRQLADPAARPTLRGTKGVHIMVPRNRVRNNDAITITSPIDGRVMFVLPAGTHTIVGTTDTDYGGPPDQVHATPDDIVYLLRSVNAYFPAAHLAAHDVVSAWAGIRPLVASGDGAPGTVSREHAIHWTVPALLTISGGKLTTHRLMAAQAVDAIAKRLGVDRPRASTDRTRLPGGDIPSMDGELDQARAKVGDADIAEHLVTSYGTGWRHLWRHASEHDALRARIVPELPYIMAELRHVVSYEMALTLGDILIRRLHLAFDTPDHARELAPRVAEHVAALLGWTADDIARELERYEQEIARMFSIGEPRD